MVAVLFFPSLITIAEAQTIHDSKKPCQEVILSLKWQVKIITPLECTRKIGKVKVVKQASVKVINTHEIAAKSVEFNRQSSEDLELL